MSQGSGLGRPSTPPVSPLSEKMPPLPTPPSTRSVSAAVSDESVAGDSGVFEASNKSHNTVPDFNSDTAQIQIKLRLVPSFQFDFKSTEFFCDVIFPKLAEILKLINVLIFQ